MDKRYLCDRSSPSAIYPRKFSRLPLSMYASTKTGFSWVGQFISFVPGRKSPYAYLAMQVTAADDLETLSNPSQIDQRQIKLGGDLRRMMVGYLQPQDWIRVVGGVKTDGQTGEPLWKAAEIVKISVQQAHKIMEDARAQQAIGQVAVSSVRQSSQPTRILICQKSSCQQRGSQAVGNAIARTLKNTGQSSQVQLQPTGCMKQCNSGPHIVLVPAKQPQQKMATTKYTHVTPDAATKIIETIL